MQLFNIGLLPPPTQKSNNYMSAHLSNVQLGSMNYLQGMANASPHPTRQGTVLTVCLSCLPAKNAASTICRFLFQPIHNVGVVWFLWDMGFCCTWWCVSVVPGTTETHHQVQQLPQQGTTWCGGRWTRVGNLWAQVPTRAIINHPSLVRCPVALLSTSHPSNSMQSYQQQKVPFTMSLCYFVALDTDPKSKDCCYGDTMDTESRCWRFWFWFWHSFQILTC